MLMDNHGQIRVLEAFFATVVVFGSLILTGPAYVGYQNRGDNEVLYSIGLNALIELDREGELGGLIVQSNWTEISNRLSLLLPFGVSFNATVYDEDHGIVNSSPITDGVLEGRTVVSVRYLVVNTATLGFYEVTLQMAYIK